MDEIKRIFNYKVKLFNSVTINKILETWVSIYAEKFLSVSRAWILDTMMLVQWYTWRQVRFYTLPKQNQSAKFTTKAKKVALIDAKTISLWKRTWIYCKIDAHIASNAHTVCLHVLMKSVFRCCRNQSTRYFISFKSRPDLRNATLRCFLIY